MVEDAVLIFRCSFCKKKKHFRWTKEKSLEKGRTSALFLTDLLKACNDMPCDHCIAIFHVLNFDMNAFYFIFDYLKGRKKESKFIAFLVITCSLSVLPTKISFNAAIQFISL